MTELQDSEWNSDTKGEDKSSVLSLGWGWGHLGGGSWDSSRDTGWLRKKEKKVSSKILDGSSVSCSRSTEELF